MQNLYFKVDDGNFGKEFNPRAFKYTNKNLDEFFELRKKEKKMTKLRVVTNGLSYKNQCKIYSSKWQIKQFWDMTNRSEMGYYYIGPKNEKSQMLNKLKEHYGTISRKISSVELQKDDYFASTVQRCQEWD